jgi:ABC-type transport system involved in cytochrome c biogenesis ATPase subunit
MSLNLKSRIFILFGKHHAAGIACFDVSPQLRFMQFSSPVKLTMSSMENLRFVKQLGSKDNCGLSPDLLYTSGCSGLVSVCL